MSIGIYISNMEMPKDIEPGLIIEFADGIDGKRYARLYHYRHGGLTEWLEALSIPPHVDLIERSALIKKLQIGDLPIRLTHEIYETPTIIPANKKEQT